MSIAPRVVLVHRPTELEELIERHGTRGQAAFFLSTRGRRIEEAEERHELQAAAIRTMVAAIPLDWRRGSVVRADLPRFLFEPQDLIVVVGRDGLVANVAKYLDGQPVLGINPDPARNPRTRSQQPALGMANTSWAGCRSGSWAAWPLWSTAATSPEAP
jgi:hypothetical protein